MQVVLSKFCSLAIAASQPIQYKQYSYGDFREKALHGVHYLRGRQHATLSRLCDVAGHPIGFDAGGLAPVTGASPSRAGTRSTCG